MKNKQERENCLHEFSEFMSRFETDRYEFYYYVCNLCGEKRIERLNEKGDLETDIV